MTRINLLPAYQRQRLYATSILRRWVTASLLYSVVLAITAVFIHATYTIDDRSVPLELQRLQAQSAQIEKHHATTIAQLAPLEDQFALRQIVNTPPDLAILLTAVSKSCNEDAILTSLKWDIIPSTQISPSPTSAVAPVSLTPTDPLAGSTGMKIEISGLARSQPGVGLLIQRLQSTTLFDEVRLTKTSREGFLDGTALAFQLTCLVDPFVQRRNAP